MPVTRIINVNVLDKNGRKRGNHLSFVASPGNIVSCEENESDVTINGNGYTVVPGLIDSKIDSGPSESALPLARSNGTTTVIDSSSSSLECQAMRNAAASDPALPSYFASGSAIGASGYELVSMFNYSGLQTVTTVGEMRRLVETNIVSKQSDFIKIIVDQPGLELDVIQAAVTVAHRHGKLAVAQASQVEAYRLAVKCGFDILSPVPVDGELDPELIQRIVRNRVGIIPTICFLQRALPLWRSRHPEYQFSHALAAVKALGDAGARICVGSSSNNWTGLSLPFGEGLHNELQLLEEAGLSNVQLFEAVTSEPASVFRLDDRGVIEPGQLADLIMVEGDPLQDIGSLSKIRSVWFRGVQGKI
ncbi:hypothetical protein E4U42_001361 [Claviceps africana]|uniref:Amidohydrolase-related domain-containing protein n=1 Tax=Claviceps africana TaxID=83212 RepID=A0A8K0JFI2_9HYPO|nr:hypothetical protein E4U42_001361 [Claviceps africana]